MAISLEAARLLQPGDVLRIDGDQHLFTVVNVVDGSDLRINLKADDGHITHITYSDFGVVSAAKSKTAPLIIPDDQPDEFASDESGEVGG